MTLVWYASICIRIKKKLLKTFNDIGEIFLSSGLPMSTLLLQCLGFAQFQGETVTTTVPSAHIHTHLNCVCRWLSTSAGSFALGAIVALANGHTAGSSPQLIYHTIFILLACLHYSPNTTKHSRGTWCEPHVQKKKKKKVWKSCDFMHTSMHRIMQTMAWGLPFFWKIWP